MNGNGPPNWLWNAVIAYTFLTMVGAFGPARTFWLFAAIGVVGVVWGYFNLPETKGHTLEQVEEPHLAAAQREGQAVAIGLAEGRNAHGPCQGDHAIDVQLVGHAYRASGSRNKRYAVA